MKIDFTYSLTAEQTNLPLSSGSRDSVIRASNHVDFTFGPTFVGGPSGERNSHATQVAVNPSEITRCINQSSAANGSTGGLNTHFYTFGSRTP